MPHAQGRVFAYLTGEKVTDESAVHGDAAERGWVDPRWSRYEFLENRNDVDPVVDAWADEPGLADDVYDAMQYLPGGGIDDGNGTFYSQDSDNPYDREGSYSYALHFKIRTRKEERPWRPQEDGGIELSKLR